MSAGSKRGKTEDMFHIRFPANRDFLTWVELGCLARALGFPTDLVRSHVTDEVDVLESGIMLHQLNRMVELKLLHQPLHRSFNMHTADWNLCVMRKAIRMLQLVALSFEELHNIRIAYATYEAADMKGLYLDQRTLLRTLKMCHRVISPKKLMHRVKHMRSHLEEANRIQLYEFFDLVLWCDHLDKEMQLDEVKTAAGKEKDLYNLVDFKTLLSHEDQRRSRVLDERYLAEEWDFGREKLGNRHMFKGEVVYSDQRITQAHSQKRKYRNLKRAVSQSQRRVYRAHAGSIRQRPISAPDLSMYSSPRGTPRTRATSAAAMYESVQRRLHSAPSRTASRLNLSDRPTIPEHVRAHTPSIVTSGDLDDVALKMKLLEFDIATLETRCEVKKEEEKNFYIPDYQPAATETATEPAADVDKKKTKKGEEHWTPDIIENLAYPQYHLPVCHANTCDARFRGWKPADFSGPHKILTVPTFDSSPHGRLFAKQRSAMLEPVANLHRDYVVRYTSKKEATEQQRAKRPCTAPSTTPRSVVKRLGCRSAGSTRRTVTDVSTMDAVFSSDADTANQVSGRTAPTEKSYPDPSGKYTNSPPRDPTAEQSEGRGDLEGSMSKTFTSRTTDSYPSADVEESFGPRRSPDSARNYVAKQKAADENNSRPAAPLSSAPPASIRHNRSKVVDVGLMGTITLLESIQEQDTEDRMSDTSSASSSWPSQVRDAISPANPQHLQVNHQGTASSKPPVGCPPYDHVKAKDRHATGRVYRGVADSSSSAGHARASEVDSAAAGQPVSRGKPPLSTAMSKPPVHSGMSREKAEDAGRAGGGQPQPITKSQSECVSQPQRVGSASSSVTSKDSEGQEPPHAPITSITVSIRNKDQHVTSTRVNDDVSQNFDVADRSRQSPAPRSKPARTPPCVTSTPRRKIPSPGGTATRRAGQANTRAANSPDNRAASAGRDRGRPSMVLPSADCTEDGRMDWVQDQILAMNPATYDALPQTAREDAALETSELGDVSKDVELDLAEPGRKKSIQFSEDTQDPRQTRYHEQQRSRQMSERMLRLKSFDLNAETPRKFSFNKVTTRRLLQRVKDIVSPELMSRISSGNTGLQVA